MTPDRQAAESDEPRPAGAAAPPMPSGPSANSARTTGIADGANSTSLGNEATLGNGRNNAFAATLALLAIAANLLLALAVWTHQPWAGGPAEWRWEYLPAGDSGGPGQLVGSAPARSQPAAASARSEPAARSEPWAQRQPSALRALAIAAVTGGALQLLGLWIWRRAAQRRLALCLALAAGLALTIGLATVQPGGFGRVVGSLVSRNSFGYVWDAALAPPTSALLADYPAASAGLNQHSVTHPPGPILLVRALDALAGALGVPALDSLTGQAQAAIDREVRQERRHGRPVPAVPASPWTVAILAVLLPALSVLAAWPLHALALALGCDRRTALLAALLWLLVPARTLFTPSLDQAMALLAVGAAALAARGGHLRAATAGLLLFGACFTSYGSFAMVPLVALCAWAGALAGDGWSPPSPAVWKRWAFLALGLALPYAFLSVFAHHDPWRAMRVALALHRHIAIEPRSYSTWLLWNPYDLLLLLSPGVVLLAARSLASRGHCLPRAVHWTAIAWWASLALLWLSGSVRGEAGRIWLPWMPFACLLAAATLVPRLAARSDPAADGGDHDEGAPIAAGSWRPAELLPLALMASQAALLLALAARMSFVD